MRHIQVKYPKEKLILAGWSLVSATLLTLLFTFISVDVEPSFFDSGIARDRVLGAQEDEVFYAVERIVDGDTIVVSHDGNEETVRLLGIDTPETKHPSKPVECFGEEAAQRLTELLFDQQVLLEADVTQADEDQYGRLLRYVFLPDGVHVNELMIAEGYAFEYTYESQPYQYQVAFMEAQQEARAQARGLWGEACLDVESS